LSGPVFKIKNDPRITRVGKWMRLDVQILLRTVPVVLTARGAHETPPESARSERERVPT
jgi:lipopolysaccharide/colanic/teichoic acid biosynthesis glycosyltransferase